MIAGHPAVPPPGSRFSLFSSDTDIFVPHRRMRGDELRHHRDASLVLHDIDADAARSEQRFFADERAVLADDYLPDPVEEDGAAAHRARRQGGVHHALAVDGSGVTAGALERVHLAVQHGAAQLDASIVPAPEYSRAMHQHGAD